MTKEEANMTIDYLKEMQESYIEGEGYERHPLPEWYALDKAIETIEQTTWIPVSERLPEEYGEYLITWKNPKYPKTYIGICECEITDVYDHEHHRFEVEWLFDGHITTAYPDSYVIAWMPLPKPYEPQENEKVNCKSTKCDNCINHNYCDFEPQESEE